MASDTTTTGNEERKDNWLSKKIDKRVRETSKNDPLRNPNTAFGELNEDKYKAELQLVDRYQSFVGELLRLSLLGIAVFGFLYTRQIFQGLGSWELPAKYLAAASIVAFGVSAGLALAFRFFAAEGATKYIEALRLPKALRLPINEPGAQNSPTSPARNSLDARMRRIYLARLTKLWSAVLLGVGGFLVAGCITTLLFSSTPAATSTPEQQKDELKELFDSGAIGEEEFENMKERVDIKEADELKKSGVITDEEYIDMKEQIQAVHAGQ